MRSNYTGLRMYTLYNIHDECNPLLERAPLMTWFVLYFPSHSVSRTVGREGICFHSGYLLLVSVCPNLSIAWPKWTMDSLFMFDF